MAIPPPPYSDIAGTSAIIGKYNQQETLAEADGNARPGQLVVNLALIHLNFILVTMLAIYH